MTDRHMKREAVAAMLLAMPFWILPVLASTHRLTGIAALAGIGWSMALLIWMLATNAERRGRFLPVAMVAAPACMLLPLVDSLVLGAVLLLLAAWNELRLRPQLGALLAFLSTPPLLLLAASALA